MKKQTFIILVVTIITTLSINLLYSDINKKAGTTTAGVLKIDSSAIVASLSGAYTSLNLNANSVFYNPAALSFIGKEQKNSNFPYKISFNVGYLLWFQDISSFSSSVAYSLGKLGTIGAGFKFLNKGEITTTTINPIDYSLVEGEVLSSSDKVIYIGYGINDLLLKNLSFGINSKIILLQILDEEANGVAFDIGAQYTGIVKILILGFTLANLGTKIKFIEEKESLPLYIRMGAIYAYKINEDYQISPIVEFSLPFDNKIQLLSGVDFSLMKIFHIRAGYSIFADIGNFSVGAGINLKTEKFTGGLNYSLKPFSSELGMSHLIELNFLL